MSTRLSNPVNYITVSVSFGLAIFHPTDDCWDQMLQQWSDAVFIERQFLEEIKPRHVVRIVLIKIL